MSKKPTVLFTLAMLAFGGYVGFVTNYTNTATAHEYVIPKFTDVPRTKDFNIDINLNNNAIKLNGQSNPEQNINVEIKKKDSIIYLTSVVEKEVPKYIKVRELPSVKENKTTCTDILQRLKQQQSEKINLSRNLNSQCDYRATMVYIQRYLNQRIRK